MRFGRKDRVTFEREDRVRFGREDRVRFRREYSARFWIKERNEERVEDKGGGVKDERYNMNREIEGKDEVVE